MINFGNNRYQELLEYQYLIFQYHRVKYLSDFLLNLIFQDQ